MRRLFREYAQEKEGKEAVSFVEIKQDYDVDTLITRDKQGMLEKTYLGYDRVLYWACETGRLRNKQ